MWTNKQLYIGVQDKVYKKFWKNISINYVWLLSLHYASTFKAENQIGGHVSHLGVYLDHPAYCFSF